MRAQRAWIAILFVAACARQITAVGQSGFAPTWHVGDWWVVKTWEPMTVSGNPEWHYMRYDVLGIEKVSNRDCFMLQAQPRSRPSSVPLGIKYVFYVRVDDWLAVRRACTITLSDTVIGPTVTDYPHGLLGPFPGEDEPRLPRFPFQIGSHDTAFRSRDRDDHRAAAMREIASIGDPALAGRLLSDGDTAGTRALRPTGEVYQMRNEIGGSRQPGPLPGQPTIYQSLQFWSEDLPWRVYEELVSFDGKKRCISERSWLIAVGHKGK